jgi:hypothetical protein
MIRIHCSVEHHTILSFRSRHRHRKPFETSGYDGNIDLNNCRYGVTPTLQLGGHAVAILHIPTAFKKSHSSTFSLFLSASCISVCHLKLRLSMPVVMVCSISSCQTRSHFSATCLNNSTGRATKSSYLIARYCPGGKFFEPTAILPFTVIFHCKAQASSSGSFRRSLQPGGLTLQ